MTEGAVQAAAHRLRGRYRGPSATDRRHARRPDEAAIDDEIRGLFAALGA